MAAGRSEAAAEAMPLAGSAGTTHSSWSHQARAPTSSEETTRRAYALEGDNQLVTVAIDMGKIALC
jgi:hypothetical protein